MLSILLVLLNVLFAVGIFIVFRLVPKYKSDALHVLAISYLFSAITSYFSIESPQIIAEKIHSNMLIPAIVLGILYVVTYFIVSISTAKSGVGITSAASKMSVVIPVLIGIVFLKQHNRLVFKLLGLLLIVISFFFIFSKTGSSKQQKILFLLPLLVFFGSGITDSSTDLSQHFFAPTNELRSCFLFFVFIASTLVSWGVAGGLYFKTKVIPNKATFILGITLGFLNFGTTYLMMKNMHEISSSVFFPIFNASVVVLSALVGRYFFKEKLPLKTYIGIAIALAGVVLVAMVK